MGYEPIIQPQSLALGKIVHLAHEAYYSKVTDQEVLTLIKQKFADIASQAGPEAQEDIYLSQRTALAMWQYNPSKSIVYQKYLPEKSLSATVGSLRGVRSVGRIDAAVLDKGLWWIREIKTTGRRLEDFEQAIQTSPQATHYVWMCQANKLNMNGVLYEYIKRPQLRKKVNETMYDFADRIELDYKLNPDKYFAVRTAYRNEDQIKLYEKELIEWVKELRWRTRRGAWCRNLENCNGQWGSECPFKKVCLTEEPDSLTLQLYFKRREA